MKQLTKRIEINCLLQNFMCTTMVIVMSLFLFPVTGSCFQLPQEMTSTIKDSKAINTLQNNPELVKEIEPLFKDEVFTSTLKELEPFQQRIVINKAAKNKNFRTNLTTNYKSTLPASGLTPTSSSFTSALVTAHKNGKVKISKEGKVQGFRPGHSNKSRLTNKLNPITAKLPRKRPSISTTSRTKPSITTTRTKPSITTTRTKPSITTTRTKRSISTPSRTRPPISTTSKPKPPVSTTSRPEPSVSTTSETKPSILNNLKEEVPTSTTPRPSTIRKTQPSTATKTITNLSTTSKTQTITRPALPTIRLK